MAARPRKYKKHVPNLYQKTDKRNGITYFTYRHPETGKFIGLGSDRAKAFEAAREANLIFAERKLEQLSFIIEQDERVIKEEGISAACWTERYIALQNERLEHKELKPETVRTKIYRASLFGQRFGNKGIRDITTKDIVDVLDEYKSEGKQGMARNIRASWKDMYQEAQFAGEVDSGFNPVATTRSVKVIVQRQRMNENDVNIIISSEAYKARFPLQMAVKLAITTALRRNDIVNLKFSDIKGGYLYVATSKSNGKTKIAFPLELTNPYLGESLGEIISECRSSRVLSKYLVHHIKQHSGKFNTVKGQAVQPGTISTMFYETKKSCERKVAEKNISFHEIRSFSERSYRDAGYDTKILLGHSSQETTDLYNDNRIEEYCFIKIPV